MTLRTPEAREIRSRYKNLLREERQERQKAKTPQVVKVGQEPRKQEPKYLQWIRRLPCVACVLSGAGLTSTSEAAHVRAGYAEDGWRPTGMMEKPHDRRTVPLCRWHHRDAPNAQHRMNERMFWEQRRIYPPTLCARLSAAYDANSDGAEVIRTIAQEARRV